jgi:hypothetical protein
VFKVNDRKYKIVLSCPRNWGQDFFIFVHFAYWQTKSAVTGCHSRNFIIHPPHQFVNGQIAQTLPP